ncbi:hypothetical protein LWI29_027674 [Acer saccharum]|uniref:Uncharacterized protein n=1 Tax=Acer saccharum TaxID=4024 RepID=A0AA39S252_ACESA|nr:hypothetical protein LWI29_027674 [Acer saccharum]
MASRKLVRDSLLCRQTSLFLQLTSKQGSSTRLRLLSPNGNPEFRKSVKELKEKAGELKEVKDELKVRTKQTTEQLYKHVDDVWTEAESSVKKVR